MKRLVLGLYVLLSVGLLTVLLSCSQGEAAASAGETVPREETMRILVLGKDRAAGLTDAMFLFAVDAAGENTSVLQIPRDTYAEYTERDYRKLNGALNALGDEGMRRFLERALGVPIDATVILDLDAVRLLVDAVGGVDVEIPEAMQYSDPAQGLEIRLPAGKTHLDGAMAEQFVRFRSGYANADLGRLDAQKSFLRAMLCATQRLTPLQRVELFARCSTHVTTDLGVGQMLRLAERMQGVPTDGVRMQTLPGEAVRGVSGAWYYCLQRERAIRVLSETMLLDKTALHTAFDPDGVFDRAENADFHKIYITPDDGR